MSIIFHKVEYTYNDDFKLEADLEIPENKWTMIVGKNGAGKSTLLKLLTGVLLPDTGSIQIDKSKVGYIFQNPDDQIIQLSLEKELAFNLENKGMPVEKIRNKIEEFLTIYNFQGRGKQSPNELSGGEKQRLALASTMISEPDILIFDEPTGFLDFIQKAKLYRIIEALRKQKTIIWVTHELDELLLADYIIDIDNGSVSYFGSQQDYLKKLAGKPIIQEHYLKCI